MKFTLHRVEDVPEDLVCQVLVEFMEGLEEGKSPVLNFRAGDERSHEQVARDWIAARNDVVR